MSDLDRLAELRRENADLRRMLLVHPAAETLRFIAPLVRDAIAAGVWKPGHGTEAVEREVASMLAWLGRRGEVVS